MEEEQSITPKNQIPSQETNLETFRTTYRECIKEILQDVEDQTYDFPVPPHPHLLDRYSRTFDDFTQEELAVAQDELYKELGIVSEAKGDRLLRSYESADPNFPDKKINISIYKTSVENVFLHELTYQDGQTRWVVGPDMDL